MEKDWIVHTIFDRGPSHWYRYQVTGVNLSTTDETRREFSWSVPSLDDPRYDLSNAKQVNEVQYAKVTK